MAKRSIMPKFRKTDKVNYRQEDEIVDSQQSCTSLKCSINRTSKDGEIDITRQKSDTGIQYRHEKKEDVTGFIPKQYIRYESVFDDMLIGIENLNSGYLTHHILDPQVPTKYLEIIEDDLEEMAPEDEPVFTSVYQYYGNSLASFTNTIDDLLLQLPIWIKLKVQVPMSLFSVETVPVPLDAET